MTEENFKYFIGIGLPDKETKLFAFIKQSFHPQGKLTSPPHVTLMRPFPFPNEVILMERLNGWARAIDSFEIDFNIVDNFHQPNYSTIFLAPEEDGKLQRMMRSLEQKFHWPEQNFTPHLTIAQRIPLNKIDETKEKIKMMKLELKLKIDKITIYRIENGSSWCKFSEISLKDGKLE